MTNKTLDFFTPCKKASRKQDYIVIIRYFDPATCFFLANHIHIFFLFHYLYLFSIKYFQKYSMERKK